MYNQLKAAISRRISGTAWFGVVLCGFSTLGQVACSRQPELISPAAKADPKQDDEPAALVVDKGDETPASEAKPAAEQVVAAKPNGSENGVKPVTHVVDVAAPTLANRSILDGPAKIAKVMMSEAEKKLCKLNVGDQIPTISLPNLAGQETKVSDLTGDKLTVVVFWNPADSYSTWELADLTGDVLKPYESAGVSVVSICSGSEAAPVDAAAAQVEIEKAGAKYPALIDANGGTLAQFGTDRTSRTYLIDAEGKILWFDMEYSRSTRRELKAALSYVIDGPPKAKPAEPAKAKPAAKSQPSSKAKAKTVK